MDHHRQMCTSGDLKKLRKIFGPPAILIRNFSYYVNHGALNDKYLQSIKVGAKTSNIAKEFGRIMESMTPSPIIEITIKFRVVLEFFENKIDENYNF